MKNLVKMFGMTTVGGVGVYFGYWLWDNILEEKVEDFKDYLDDKRKRGV